MDQAELDRELEELRLAILEAARERRALRSTYRQLAPDTDRRFEVARRLVAERGMSVQAACELAGIPRSTYYYRTGASS